MLGIPSLGARVTVWPAPGLKVQLGDRTLDSGGRWMRASGESVIWSAYNVEQLRAGEIMLHPPVCDEHSFGEDGKADACLHCGRDQKAAEKYHVERAPGLELAQQAAAAETEDETEAAPALQPRTLALGEMLAEAPLPTRVVADGPAAITDQPKGKE
jgi:hypothetical protein